MEKKEKVEKPAKTKKKMRPNKRFKLIILILIAIIVLMLSFILLKKFVFKPSGNGNAGVVDEIKTHGYTLKENSPAEYKKMYKELEKILSSDEIDEEAYAKQIARMLVFDFYNIDSKISKNDIGGAQFILEKYRNNFILEASETVYKYVEHNIYGDRTQELPVVTSTEVTDIKKSTYSYDDIVDDNCYVINVAVTYKKDLGYPTEVTVKLVHNGDKLEAFYMK